MRPEAAPPEVLRPKAAGAGPWAAGRSGLCVCVTCVADIGVARVENLATESLEGLPGGLVARGGLQKVRLQDVVVADGARGVVTVFYIHLCAAGADE